MSEANLKTFVKQEVMILKYIKIVKQALKAQMKC